MVTIYDIAEKTKVSASTVSRVVNGGSVYPKTKRKVLKAIEKYGYVPDNRAVYLKKERTKKIGLIIPDISNPFYPVGVKAIHDILKFEGYHLILGNTYGEISEEKDILRMMERERVAGIILHTCEGEDDSKIYSVFERLIKNKISLIFMGKKRDNLPVDVISINNFSGVLKATDYLIRIGRKKIGFIAGKRDLRATEERLSGYIESLKRNNIPVREDLIICDGKYTMEYGEKWGEILMKEKKVDAILCGNDLLAIGAIKVSKKLHIKVPDEVAIVGFDDIALASVVTPELTTIHQPLEKISAIACDLLFGRINGTLIEEPKDILIEPELIIRESA